LATLKMNRAMQFIFGSLTLLFLLLALGDITGNATLKKVIVKDPPLNYNSGRWT